MLQLVFLVAFVRLCLRIGKLAEGSITADIRLVLKVQSLPAISQSITYGLEAVLSHKATQTEMVSVGLW